METRTDYLLDGRVRVTQSAEGYRAGLDAVMLAAACPIAPHETLLDMGCGAGAASLCVAARVAGIHITGIEIQPAQADLARGNFNSLLAVGRRWHGEAVTDEGGVKGIGQSSQLEISNSKTPPHPALRATLSLQGEGRYEVICADLKEHKFTTDSFDHVMMNPPYHDAARHDAPQNTARAAAFMGDDLAAWLATARRVVKTYGSLTLIHRADAVVEILQNMSGFGAVEIIPLWPRAGQSAERIIIRARKGRKTPPRLHAGIVLHTAGGDPTEVAHNILYKGAKIP